MQDLKQLLAYTGINVEQLVDDYTQTLKDNGNPSATSSASIVALKEWAMQKEYLIRQIMAMPGYNGNLQSVGILEIPYERTADDVYASVMNLWRKLFDNGFKILSRTDSNGKTIEDYIKEDASGLPKRVPIKSLTSYSGKKSTTYAIFDDSGYTKESIKNKDTVYNLLNLFRYYTQTRLNDRIVESIKNLCPDLGVAIDMKTTRALGKIIKKYGLEDKTAGSTYGKEFIANYCEVMKEGNIKREFVVSVNPIDYLKMSIGDFTSCHDIRGGGWRSGTIAYMLDKVSIITYTVKPNSTMEIGGNTVNSNDRPELFSKVERNVFHWDSLHRLIQSRVYPQAKDGCTDLYAVFRHEMQRRIALANGWEPENWTNRKRRYTDFTRAGEGATNYPDWSYERFGGNLSTPGHSFDPYSTETIIIGAKPTCIRCGSRHSSSNRMLCYSCY